MQEFHDTLQRLETAVYTINGRTEMMDQKLDDQSQKIDGLTKKYDERIDGPNGLQVQVSRNTEDIRSFQWKWKALATGVITVVVTWAWSKVVH